MANRCTQANLMCCEVSTAQQVEEIRPFHVVDFMTNNSLDSPALYVVSQVPQVSAELLLHILVGCCLIGSLYLSLSI